MTRSSLKSTVALCALLLLLASATAAQEPSSPEAVKPEPVPTAVTSPVATRGTQRIVYVDPGLGAPVRTGGGATRFGEPLPDISVLTPKPPARTTKPQPVLYWFLSRQTNLPVVFFLGAEDADDPLREETLAGPHRAGIYAIRLAELGVRLEEGLMYRWSVALVREGDRAVSEGAVRYVPAPRDLERALLAAPHRKAEIYAESAIWYEAFETLSEEITAAPQDVSRREVRALLLEQVGLEGVAGYERAQP